MDSLTYLIETGDIYEDILPDATEHFDCSEYPESHILYSTVNKKKLGKWKDENSKTGPIRQFVGIRAKMYSIRCEKKKDDKLKAKGIVKAYHQQFNIGYELTTQTFRQSTVCYISQTYKRKWKILRFVRSTSNENLDNRTQFQSDASKFVDSTVSFNVYLTVEN